MSKFRTALAFLLGAAAGSIATWRLLKDAYTYYAEQDIASAKEAFHIREEKLREELKTESVSEETGDAEKQDKPRKTPGGKYTKYTPQVVPNKEVTDETKKRDIEAPYVIPPEEFGELDGYTQVSLTYYADGILADEQGIIIDDQEEIVGDALEHFGEYEDDSVYCRSDPKRCDYEILQDLRKYADVRKSFPPNI